MKDLIRYIILIFSIFYPQARATTTLILDCGKHNGYESEAIFDSDRLDVTLNFIRKIPEEKIQMRLIEECLYIASKQYKIDEIVHGRVTLDGKIEPFSPDKFIAPTVSYNYFIYYDYKTKKVKSELNTYGP